MDVYITFYTLGNEKFLPTNRYMFVYNGFSFGREKKQGDVDLFFSQHDSPQYILTCVNSYNPERVWCSLVSNSQFDQISSIMNERWILGGPLIVSLLDRKDELAFRFPFPTFVYTTMEEFLGKEISSDFDPYFLDFISSFPNYFITYSISMGTACCWGKCSYCTFDKFVNTRYERSDPDRIIKQSIHDKNRKLMAYACQPSTSPETLEKIIKAEKTNGVYAYVRADKNIRKLFKDIDLSFDKCYFSVGLEGFSDSIVKELNKGFGVSDVFEVIEETVKKDGFILVNLMGRYSFLSEIIIDECKNNIALLKEIISRNGKQDKILLSDHGSVVWKTAEDAEKFGYPSTKLTSSLFTYYITDLPENSDQYKFNQQMKEIIYNSGFKILDLSNSKNYRWFRQENNETKLFGY